MLRRLTVRNFAVVAELRLEPGEGLNVFTGQTGAGKSVLIEALGFLFGARGSLDWIRSGEKRLEVEGVFDAADLSKELRAAFKVDTPATTLRRELDASGKTRAFVQSQSCAVSVLAQIGERLVDFHGQHEHQSLMKSDRQLDILDGYGALAGLRRSLAEAHARWSKLVQELQSLQLSDEERLKRLDLYRYQLSEIDQVDPKPGEEEELEGSLPRLKNAERLGSLAAQAHGLLYEQEGSAQELLLKAERALEELSRLDPSLSPESASLAQARVSVQDVASRLAGYQGQVEASPERLDALLGRLDRIGRLKKKYGPAVLDVVATRERLITEVSWLENSQERAGEVEAAAAKARRELEALCAEAHKARMGAAARLSTKVTQEIRTLGMPSAKFSVCVEMEENEVGLNGADLVDFLIAPNPGESLKPLKSVASGGELSRVMLALKTILAKNDRVPILVFDEVDTGVGGEVGRLVGRRLAGLAGSHQVLCVTHLPQVACFASRHFHVEKEVQGGRTFVLAQVLEGDGRLEALARMLGGKEATVVSRRHAKELLEESTA